MIEADGGPHGGEADDERGKPGVERPFQRGAAEGLDDEVDKAVFLAEHPVDGDADDQGAHQHRDVDHGVGQALEAYTGRGDEHCDEQRDDHAEGQAADGVHQRAAHGRVEFGILKQCDIVFDADEVHDLPAIVVRERERDAQDQRQQEKDAEQDAAGRYKGPECTCMPQR